MTKAVEQSHFTCDCEDRARSACTNYPFYREYEKKRYCVLHYPSKEKIADFMPAINSKLSNEDFDFQAVWFPVKVSFINHSFKQDASFRLAVFDEEADFFGATFEGEASFSGAKFNRIAIFQHTTFTRKANFVRSEFGKEAIFLSTTFNGRALFNKAVFDDVADFDGATFKAEANFLATTFRSYAKFLSDISDPPMFSEEADVAFKELLLEKQGHISFHTVTLRPHWFLNVDSRKFDFINVRWLFRSIKEDVRSLSKLRNSQPYKLLAIAYRHLAVNAEESHRYEEASRFRYLAMDVQRQEAKHGIAFWRLHWWYWLASGYGERIGRALLFWIAILVAFAVLYTKVGFNQPSLNATKEVIELQDTDGLPLSKSQALVYSFEVMILQKPEPKPLTWAARSLVGAETILGPLQAALLALAIRRKFMR